MSNEARHPSALAGTGAAHTPSYPIPREKPLRRRYDPVTGFTHVEGMPDGKAIIRQGMRNFGFGREPQERPMPVPKKRGGDEW